MSNLLNRRDDECRQLQDLLEDAETRNPRVASIEKLLEALPPVQRTHFAACADCRDAVRELLAARQLLGVISPSAQEPGPWFVTRVMAAIVAREKELSEVTKAWMAVPKFASRLALISAALLLVTSTWLYEKPFPSPSPEPASVAAQESLFESAPPMANQDDVLLIREERNP